MPKVAVIVPVYNVEEFLGECIDSIITGSFADFSLYLVDDCSTDGSYQIMLDYARKDSRIRIFQTKTNSGVGAPRNLALDNLADEEFLAFIDSDDVVAHNYLELLLHAQAQSGADIVQSNWLILQENADGDYIKKEEKIGQRAVTLPDSRKMRMRMLVEDKLPVEATQKLIRRSLFDEHNLRFAIRTAEDLLLMVPLTYYAPKIVWIPFYGYHYRQHPNSVMHKTDLTKARHSLVSQMQALKQLEIYLADFDLDFNLKYELRLFIARRIFYNMFAWPCGNLDKEELLNLAAEVFSEHGGDMQGLLCYFFKEYLLQRDKDKSIKKARKHLGLD